jgi:hypothetical protein
LPCLIDVPSKNLLMKMNQENMNNDDDLTQEKDKNETTVSLSDVS